VFLVDQAILFCTENVNTDLQWKLMRILIFFIFKIGKENCVRLYSTAYTVRNRNLF
jgi:hypothetical protein